MMRNPSIMTKILLLSTFVALFWPAESLLAGHGVSIDGNLKYPAGFKRFAYTSESASKGGQLVLHELGSFDKMNPYTLKGTEPAGLDTLVFETLAIASLDEPFAEYGLIASDIELAKDRLSVTFTIDPKAKFSDGSAILPEDVKFSLDIMKSDQAHPSYQAYFQDISKAEVLDSRRVRFQFAKTNRELHLIAAQLPIFSKKFYTAHPFDASSMTPPLGSGPYVVAEVNPGKTITYRKNPQYWAKDHQTRQGMFNFETIVIKYYKDQIVAVEAFKAHEFDFMYVNIAKQWVRDLTGAKFNENLIRKESLPHKNNAGMQAFVFNLRRPLFQDRRVREALDLAFDFEWTNQTLFFDQYTRCNSFFSNSFLAAIGLPSGPELKYLTPLKALVPAEVFTSPLTPVSTLPPGSLRDNLKKASRLLAEAGWTVKNGKLVDAKGAAFEFEILLSSTSFERVIAPYAKNLEKLGIIAKYRTIDPALYTRHLQEFDFDMVVQVFGQSQSPGNEQRDYWHSSAADRKGSRNIIGIKDKAVDNLVDKVIYAENQEQLTAACQALDRVLWHNRYVIPNWYVNSHRVTYWNTFDKPATQPVYYTPFQALMTWWLKK